MVRILNDSLYIKNYENQYFKTKVKLRNVFIIKWHINSLIWIFLRNQEKSNILIKKQAKDVNRLFYQGKNTAFAG